MVGKIAIDGMLFFAYHGYYDFEQQNGNNFIIDLEMEFNISDDALRNDTLSGTLNYENIYELVKREMEIRSKLIEHLCFRIKTSIQMEFPEILNLKISVSKLNPPIKGNVEKVKISL
jgi:dihydroneopterin aldolase